MAHRNVLITGASRGIGENIAGVLAARGYNVFITARNQTRLENLSTLAQLKGYFAADLTDDFAAEQVFNQAVSKLGGIDILINNAGGYVYSKCENTTYDQIEELIALNLKAPYRLIQKVIPQMKENQWGRIVNIGSISGSAGEAYASLYSMTKSALIGMSKALALELAENNITVNTINPGWVDTNLTQDAILTGDFTCSEQIDMIPQKRFIHPSEVSALVKYLISQDAKGITGQSINLCAGLSLG